MFPTFPKSFSAEISRQGKAKKAAASLHGPCWQMNPPQGWTHFRPSGASKMGGWTNKPADSWWFNGDLVGISWDTMGLLGFLGSMMTWKGRLTCLNQQQDGLNPKLMVFHWDIWQKWDHEKLQNRGRKWRCCRKFVELGEFTGFCQDIPSDKLT